MNFSEMNLNYMNQLIYQINRIGDRDEMRRYFLTMLNAVITCEYQAFFLSDGENRFGFPVVCNHLQKKHQKKEKFSLPADFINMRWLFDSGVNKVFRFSDYYLEKESFLTADFLDHCHRCDLRYFSLLVLSYDYCYEGCLLLIRDYESGDFTDAEIRVLDMLKDHLALRLHENNGSRKQLSWAELRRRVVTAVTAEYRLTHREAEVLALFFAGKQNHEICAELSIAESTLKKHILSFYEKINLKNRTDVVRLFGETIEKEHLL